MVTSWRHDCVNRQTRRYCYSIMYCYKFTGTPIRTLVHQWQKQYVSVQHTGALTSSVHDVTFRAESGILDCDRMSTVSDVTNADFHLREVEEQLENIFTPTPIELLKVTLRRPRETDDFGFSLSDGVFEKGVYVGAVKPTGPAAGALKPYDRVLQVT